MRQQLPQPRISSHSLLSHFFPLSLHTHSHTNTHTLSLSFHRLFSLSLFCSTATKAASRARHFLSSYVPPSRPNPPPPHTHTHTHAYARPLTMLKRGKKGGKEQGRPENALSLREFLQKSIELPGHVRVIRGGQGELHRPHTHTHTHAHIQTHTHVHTHTYTKQRRGRGRKKFERRGERGY